MLRAVVKAVLPCRHRFCGNRLRIFDQKHVFRNVATLRSLLNLRISLDLGFFGMCVCAMFTHVHDVFVWTQF